MCVVRLKASQLVILEIGRIRVVGRMIRNIKLCSIFLEQLCIAAGLYGSINTQVYVAGICLKINVKIK